MSGADDQKDLGVENNSPEVKKQEEEQAQEASNDDLKKSLKENISSFVNAEGKPIQWLLDRCNGHERVMNPNQKPCCCLLYPNGFLKLFPGLMESNPVMECFGRVGFVKPEWILARRSIFFVVMIFSTIGWICILLADLAMTRDFEILNRFDFSSGDVDFAFVDRSGQIVTGNTEIHVGVRAVAWTREAINVTVAQLDDFLGMFEPGEVIPDSEWDRFFDKNRVTQQFVTGFDSFCDGEDRVFFVDPEQCESCDEVSTSLIRGLILPTIFYFFTFKNDWLRFWPNYDVNCQKFMSFFVGSITIALALRTFFRYRSECFESFREGENCFFENSTEVDCPRIYLDSDEELTEEEFNAEFAQAQEISFADISWKAGNGFILLGVAVFVRLFSMLSNLTVPTPPITRDRALQWEYERIAKEQDSTEHSEYFLPW